MSFELSVIDLDYSSYIFVEGIFVTIFFDQFVLNVFLKAIIEALLQGILALFDPEGLLSEFYSIDSSRLSLG